MTIHDMPRGFLSATPALPTVVGWNPGRLRPENSSPACPGSRSGACGGGRVGARFRASGSGGRSPAEIRRAERPSPNLSRPAGEGFLREFVHARSPPSLPLSRLRGRSGGGPLPRQRKRWAKPRCAERPSPSLSRPAGERGFTGASRRAGGEKRGSRPPGGEDAQRSARPPCRRLGGPLSRAPAPGRRRCRMRSRGRRRGGPPRRRRRRRPPALRKAGGGWWSGDG